MTYEPLVTVVTSSWMRANTVREHAVRSVNAQWYKRIEHIVVIDGNDQATVASLRCEGYRMSRGSRRMIELGRNWSSFSGDGGFGSTCRMVGSWCAAGELITYLDDDNDYEDRHIGEMVSYFEDPTVDFVTNGPAFPPGVGRTDTSGIMHRAEVLKKAGGFALDGYEGDGRMVERWVNAGLKWADKTNGTFHLTNGYHHGEHLG